MVSFGRLLVVAWICSDRLLALAGDAKAYAAMVDGIATASGSAMMTIDFPCDGDLCDKATLTAGLKTGKFMGKFVKYCRCLWLI